MGETKTNPQYASNAQNLPIYLLRIELSTLKNNHCSIITSASGNKKLKSDHQHSNNSSNTIALSVKQPSKNEQTHLPGP